MVENGRKTMKMVIAKISRFRGELAISRLDEGFRDRPVKVTLTRNSRACLEFVGG